MPRVPPFDRAATYEDLTRLPDNLIAELVDGELHAAPRPALRHANVGTALGGHLVPAFRDGRGGPGGWWLLYEPELHLADAVLVPDWAGWRRARLPEVPDEPFCSTPPDWVCEILSASTAGLDRGRKLGIFARHQVPHAWLVDPAARTLEVLQLEGGRWTILAVHQGDATVRAVPFEDVEIPLSLVWADR